MSVCVCVSVFHFTLATFFPPRKDDGTFFYYTECFSLHYFVFCCNRTPLIFVWNCFSPHILHNRELQKYEQSRLEKGEDDKIWHGSLDFSHWRITHAHTYTLHFAAPHIHAFLVHIFWSEWASDRVNVFRYSFFVVNANYHCLESSRCRCWIFAVPRTWFLFWFLFFFILQQWLRLFLSPSSLSLFLSTFACFPAYSDSERRVKRHTNRPYTRTKKKCSLFHVFANTCNWMLMSTEKRIYAVLSCKETSLCL